MEFMSYFLAQCILIFVESFLLGFSVDLLILVSIYFPNRPMSPKSYLSMYFVLLSINCPNRTMSTILNPKVIAAKMCGKERMLIRRKDIFSNGRFDERTIRQTIFILNKGILYIYMS